MELEALEALALADDRAAALAQLLPGTVEYDYWRGIHLQHAGRLDEVDEILAGWQKRHGDTDEHHARLTRRQLLLRAGADLAAHAEKLRFDAGIWLDDEAEAVTAEKRHPTRLDPALIDAAALVRDAVARSADLSYVSDRALDGLVALGLPATTRRALLQRLTRANLPGLVALIAADLDEKSSRGFGTLGLHGMLTRAQLDELARLRPALAVHPTWVAAQLQRMRPAAQVDWEHDLDAREAYLAELIGFASSLPAAFNGLKAQLLYHRLDLDRRRGRHDRARFVEYLALPRNAGYVRSEWLRGVASAETAQLGVDAAPATGLGAIGDDEALVVEYLDHFLAKDTGADFARHLAADWLETRLAIARLLSGDPDSERWAATLGPARLADLRDQVELTLTARNPRRFAGDAPVTLEVDTKNVAQLTVKVFRIDAVAYFLARGDEVDTAIDLDGLVASDERTIASDAPAIRRVRQRIELPGCARPGTYVVELIGNGRSSRALVKKGALRQVVRVGAAGPVVRVLDDAGRPAPNARLWLGGREYAPRDDGAIAIPFSTTPGAVRVLLVDGEVAQREWLDHPAERYGFSAGLALERSSLVPGKTARVIVRPMLTVAGWPAPLALIEDARVEIAVTDRAGTPSSKSQAVTFADDAETAVELHVPEDTARIAVTVRGRVRVVSTQETIDLADGAEAAIGTIHDSAHTEALHLATTAGGHVLHLLGKTGEARGGRAVSLSFQPSSVTFEVTTTLDTDERGRIELGALDGIDRVTASLPSGVQQSWSLAPEVATPRTVHALAGATLSLPRPPGGGEAEVSLVELRGGAPARDLSTHVKQDGGAFAIAGLDAGEYRLVARDLGEVRLAILPGDATITAGWATAGRLSAELSPPTPLARALAADRDALVVRVSDSSPLTRVHVIATRFRADRALPRTLERTPRAPLAIAPAPVVSAYVDGRDIGEEYRYVLERRRQPRRPGTLLDKPGLLLNPWALRATTTAVQTAAAGGAFGASPPRPGAPAPAPRARPATGASADSAAFASLDFLAAPAVVIANLRPAADGTVRIARADLGAAQQVRVIVVDPALTSSVDLALDETSPAPRDLRLRLALDAAGHFAEDRRVDAAPAGARLVVEDVRSGKLELVDTVARAHQVLLSLGAPDPLRELGFVAQWHTLDDAARRTLYSKYACHELHLFLHFRDPEFFARVVRPYLAHKRHKTFVDHFLLGADLSAYLEPWAFGRLNALEQVLLARRVPALRDAIARLLGDTVDLIPPDPARDARLVDTLLGSTALEGGGIVASAAPEAEVAYEEKPAPKAKKMAARMMRGPSDDAPSMGGGGYGAPPAAQAAEAYASAGLDFDTAKADLLSREEMAPLYRGADKTQEWAESDWWHLRVGDVSPALIAPNRFWRDLAAHRDGPFLSPHLGECTGSFAAALCALAVLDLPFSAGKHEVVVEDARLTLTTASHALAARTRIAATDAPERTAILVGQSLFRADDRWIWDGAEQREKYVTGELLVGVVYQCQVVVTNPTSAQEKLDVLLQIPAGAMPVSRGFYTRTMHLHLGAYGTQSIEYAFYFPAPGSWTHFPAHVTRAGVPVAAAPPVALEVVRTPTTVDATSWAHVSQHGTTDEVLAFLAAANLGRLDLDRIAWRMKERDAFTRVTALLADRRVYHERLWAYGLRHADRARVAEWLRHQDDFLHAAGPALDGAPVEIDPIARTWYQHLEYAPLVNARAHQLGAKRRILNDALAAQWVAYLERVAHRAALDDEERLAAAHYLFAMDRIDDALAQLAKVRPDRVADRLQHDYLAAYAACSRGDLAAARALAAPWRDHPVDRWRNRYAALHAMLDEAAGSAPAVDADSRDQRMNVLAAQQPALDLAIEGGAVVLQHHNLTACQVRLYQMDLELLFSRQPFVQGDVERFSFIEPGAVIEVPLTSDGRTTVPLPSTMRGGNLVAIAAAPGLRRSVAHYAHDLATQLAHQYGQLRVLRASTQSALPATYVKVYARARGGAVSFFKDGYTDLRGRFDYATLSTDDLDRVERFALLVLSDDAGATVIEAPPPPR